MESSAVSLKAAIERQPSATDATNENNDESHPSDIAVGRMVEVLPRTWPGINKPGGVARVIKLYVIEDQIKHVDVHYILARTKEKQVPLDYVKLAPQYEGTANTRSSSRNQPTSSLRDRSMLLGRCKRCGSLRTDCGSCDWAFEEMHQQRILQQQEQMKQDLQNSPFRKNASSKYRKRRRGQRTFNNDGTSSRWEPLAVDNDDDSSLGSWDDSSDDEEEDDVLLQELMAQNMANYRKFRKFRVAQVMREEEEAEAQKTASAKDMVSDGFSSASDSEQEMYQSYLKRKKSLDQNKRQMKNRYRSITERNHHRSVLESIATSKNTGRPAKTITPFTKQSAAPRNDTSSHTTTSKTNDEISNTLSRQHIPPTSQQTKKRRRRRLVIQEESQDVNHLLERADEGDASDDSFGAGRDCDASLRETELDNEMNQEQEMELEQHHVTRLVRQAQEQQTNDFLNLSQFIQPEGLEVAENLPDDIVDRTRNLEYRQLPDFFDNLVTQMEDEWMPDWKLKIARLLSAKRRLEYSGFSTLTSTRGRGRSPLKAALEAALDPLQVLQRCEEIQTGLRDHLIRNGLDQCKICLHKLMDDRLYKKRRSNLNSAERKRCRGLGVMDARNLRLDALEDTVDDLVRKIREVEKVCENNLQENAPLDNGDANSTQMEMQDSEEENLKNTTLKAIRVEPSTACGNETEPTLPPFHPHMHANRRKSTQTSTRKRSQNSEVVNRYQKRTQAGHSVSRSCNRAEKRIQRVKRIRLEHDIQVNQSEEPSESIDMGESFTPDSDDDERDIEETQEDDQLPGVSMFVDTEASVGGRPKRSADEQDESSKTRIQKRAGATTRYDSKRISDQNPRSSRPARSFEQDSSVPTFNLFGDDSPQSEVEESRNYLQNQGGRRRGGSRIPISQRMQAFLLANEEGTYSFQQSMDDTSSSREQRSRASGQNRQAQESRRSSIHPDSQRKREASTSRSAPQRAFSLPNSDDEMENSFGSDSDDAIMVDLFDDLRASQYQPTPNLNAAAYSQSIVATCQQLQRQSQRREKNLEDLHTALHRVPIIPGEESLTVLTTSLALLKENGTMTLLELASTNVPNLRSHVHLLSVCLLSLNSVTECTESNFCPMVKRVVENRKAFFNMLLLQLIDTMYAVLHPSAWSFKSKRRAHILRALKPLRNSLAKVTALTESACRCILEHFGCQKWRRGLTNGLAFVSSIGASEWKEFLLNGTFPQQVTDVRLKQLGRVWPRVEIETLWSIFAYLGECSSRVDEGSVSCWQLLSKLFSSGVLFENDVSNDTAPAKSLPPSVEHLNTCEQEIGFFTDLLSKGVMKGVPSSDSMLVNLIRRSLTLEGDSYQRNKYARKKSIPKMSHGKESKRLVARLWKAADPSNFLAPDRIRSKNLPSGILSLGKAAEGEAATVKNSLLPTSNMLRRCLELIHVWIKYLPQKKVRRNRFLKAVNTMRAALGSVSCTTPRVVSPVKSNSFEAAFAVQHEKDLLVDGAEHKQTFMIEAVAWTKIIEQVALSSNDAMHSNPFVGTKSMSVAMEIWDIVADGIMKERRVALIEKQESQGTCTSNLRMFAAAKVMASIAMLQMNICPWFLDTGEKVTHVWDNSEIHGGVTPNHDAIVFTVSAVLACLDCLGDMRKSPFMPHVISIVTLVFTNMAAFFQLSVTERGAVANSQLKELSSSVLLKTVKVLINSQGDDEDAVCFQLLLSAVRSFASAFLDSGCIHPKGASAGVAQGGDAVQENDVDGGDIWGSIDDDLLASMNLDGGQAPSPGFAQELARTLKCALQQSKPSGRFSVPSGFGMTNLLQMSPHGRHFVASELDRVCQCLVSLQLAGPNLGDRAVLSDLLCIRVQSHFDDDSDSQFWVQISQTLSIELINLSKAFAICSELVKVNFERVLFNVLGMLFDSQRLEVYPSCNLERIRKYAGEEIGEQALDMLDIFNTCDSSSLVGTGIEAVAKIQRKRRRKAERVWHMCHQISHALLESESDHGALSLEGRIGSILQDKDTDLAQKAPSVLDSSSLEKEALQSFQILRTLASVIDRNEKNHAVSMESVLAFSLSIIISQSLRTMKSLKYQESIITRDSSNEQELRKIMTEELLRTYLEIFVALVAWIFRNSRDGASKQWTALELHLRDNFLTPILRRRSVDLALTLKRILRTSLTVVTGNSDASSATLRLGSISGFSNYSDGILDSIVRRSRQLFIAISRQSHFRSLQSSLLEAAIGCPEGDKELLLPRYLGNVFNTSLEMKNGPDVSPLGEGIDEYLSFVEKKVASDADCLKKSSFLDGLILPRLNHGKTKLTIKRRNLCLVGHLLEGEMSDPTIESTSIMALVKGMRRSLLQCFKEPVIDNVFLSEALSCSNRLASTPVIMDDSRQEPLLSWSRRSVDFEIPNDVAELSAKEQNGVYVWLYYKWLHSVGKIIVDTSEAGSGKRTSFRKLCKNDEESGIPMDLSQMMQEMDLKSSHQLLCHVEGVLFPSRDENSASLANVYANERLSQDSTSQQVEDWKPTAGVRKCAKELMAEVVAQG
ncbi:unnamed protein product [Cylindrotheca closterium]|uniref:Uncharacterized protein n=1 Tax=Cylindrotheca closterium TaxID=2856 RepID=A0AAD2PVB5_9STRA|nr:unnamed protein product [Cylindrotheca closterium]